MTSFQLSDLPGPLLEFRDLFRDGRYWESHEALEDAWREGRSAFYHGLILYASAFVHAARDNAHGVVAQLDKTLDALADHPDAYLGVDVAALREHARTCRLRVRQEAPTRRSEGGAPAESPAATGGGEEGSEAPAGKPTDATDPGTPWIRRLPTPTLELDPSRVRGDEPELEPGGEGPTSSPPGSAS